MFYCSFYTFSCCFCTFQKDEGGVVLVADDAAIFLSGRDIVRYPGNNAITVSRMADQEAGDELVCIMYRVYDVYDVHDVYEVYDM